MSQVSRLELDADSSKLIVTLHNPPKFYICGLMNQEDSMNEGLDFTAGEELSRFPAHAILRPVSVDRGEFKRLKDWLHNQATRPEQDAAEWYATRQAVELAEPYQNTGASVSPLGVFVNPAMGLKGHEDTSLEHVINANTERWIQSVDPNPSSANTLENIPLTSDEDNMLTASEGLSWSSESEYFAALTTAKRQRVSRHSLGLNNNSSAGQWRPLPDLPVPWVNREVGRGGITIPPKKSSRQPHWLVRGAQSLVNRFGLEEAADGGITDKSRQTPGQDLKDQHIISRTDTLDSANRQVGKRGITQQGTSTSPQQHSLPPHELITRGKPEEAESPELQVTEGRNTDKSRQVLEDGDFTDQDNKSQPDTLESTNLEAGRKRETAEQGTATSPRRPPRRPHWLIRNAQSLVNRLELEKGDRP
ncbi:hypothetical protein F5Y14DRAFT_117189 [Nemania sp. NC0429]|nr:hypothetical protein F5Y14DRAFT_117189 [Nemania sp. NC0429]